MNLQTGLKEAKLSAEKKGIQSKSSVAAKSVTESEEGDTDVKNLVHSLEQLPVPPTINEMTLHDAYAKLSPEEFQSRVIQLWSTYSIFF